MRTDPAQLNAILSRPGYAVAGSAPVAPKAHALVLPYPPSANAYWRSFVIAGRVRVVVSNEAKKYKGEVARTLAGCGRIAGPVALSVRFYRPRRIGDLDNLLKVLLDSLKGYAFEDDKQVVEISALRFDDKERPRVEVGIRPAA